MELRKGRAFFEVESCWNIEAELPEILQIFEDPLSLTRWWAPVFMRGEMVARGEDSRLGFTARFHTKGLLPHTFQFTARIDHLDTSGELRIRTWGDFDGLGDIKLEGGDGRTVVRIRWRTDVHQPYIRGLIRIFKPVFTANHRWAMRRGREGLQAEVLRRRNQDGVAQAELKKPVFPHSLPMVQRRFRWTRDAAHWGMG